MEENALRPSNQPSGEQPEQGQGSQAQPQQEQPQQGYAQQATPGNWAGQQPSQPEPGPAQFQAYGSQNPGYQQYGYQNQGPQQGSYQQGPYQGGYSQNNAYPAQQQQPYSGYYPAYGLPKSRLAAGLLGIFLGGYGVHNFYLGFYTKAIIQVSMTVVGFVLGVFLWFPFFLCFAASIWGLIEGICILVGTPAFSRDARNIPLTD